jgi:hypothetical protein
MLEMLLSHREEHLVEDGEPEPWARLAAVHSELAIAASEIYSLWNEADEGEAGDVPLTLAARLLGVAAFALEGAARVHPETLEMPPLEAKEFLLGMLDGAVTEWTEEREDEWEDLDPSSFVLGTTALLFGAAVAVARMGGAAINEHHEPHAESDVPEVVIADSLKDAAAIATIGAQWFDWLAECQQIEDLAEADA